MKNDDLMLSALRERIHAISKEHWQNAEADYPGIMLTLRDFEEKVLKILKKILSKIPKTTHAKIAERELTHVLSQLHWRELYLTTACALGIEAAWETFHLQYRSTVLKTAMRSASNASEGQEMADSFLSELFLPSQAGSSEGEKKSDNIQG